MHDKTRQDITSQGKTIQEYKTSQANTRQDKAIQEKDKPRQNNTL